MQAHEGASYREELARANLHEAERARRDGAWWSAALHAQMAVENSAKAVCAHFGAVPRTHDIGGVLRAMSPGLNLADEKARLLEELICLADEYGHDAHVRFSYGDEETLKPPGELVTEAVANEAVSDAGRALELSDLIRAEDETEEPPDVDAETDEAEP